MAMVNGNANIHSESQNVLDQRARGFRGGAEVGRAVFPTHLQWQGHNVVVLSVAQMHRELVDKVPLFAFFHNHVPEAIREVDLVPIDLPVAVRVEHKMENAVHGSAKSFDTGLVFCWYHRLID